jgi:hypothetical protein
MAVVINNPLSVVTFTNSGVTFLTTYTVPAGARALYIIIYADNGNATVPLPDICSYAGVNAVLVAQTPVDAAATGQLHFVYRINNPASGANSLQARHPSFSFSVAAFSVSATNNINQTVGTMAYANSASPVVGVASATGNTTVFSLTVNNVATTAVSELTTVLSEGGSAANAMHQLSYMISPGSDSGAAWSITGGAQRWSAIAINIAEDTASITSINAENPVTVGQVGMVIAHTGFTGAITSVTTNRSGVTCSIASGNATSTSVNVAGWVDGGPYPVVDNSVTFTVSRAGESASGTQTLTRPANWAQQTFSGAILDNPNLIGFNLAAAGHTVNGGAFYYRTNQVSSLTVNADTSWTSAPAGGTFDAVFIPSTGATAGNAYLFEITVLNGSIVVAPGGGLTSIGLTAIGLGAIGLTAIGFGSSGQSGPTSLLFDDTQLLDDTILED